VLWTVFGVLFLTLIDNSLNLLSLSHFTIMMVKGGVILFAAILDTLRMRVAMQSR
jgi:ribose/xylose/arabinose/galactoside ABC-type transport system permease subunit